MPMRTSKRAAIATLAVAALITGLAACAPSTGGGSGGGDTILTVGRSSASVQKVFNPYLPTTAYQLGSEGMIYEPLVQVNTTKAGDFEPWLATEWEWNAEGTELSLQLRDGVTWTDGEDFTSEDVVYSYQLIKDHPELNLTGIQFDTVTAPDEHSVVLTFATPSANFFDKIIYLSIVPEHIYGEIDDVAGYADEKPVGTGPFMLDTFTPESYTLVKNPDYWQKGKPEIDGLRFVPYKDNTAVSQAMVQGDVDWCSCYMANVEETFLSKSPDFHILWSVVGADGLITNNQNFPFNEKEIREAASLAIDRQQVADVANRPAATWKGGLPLPVFEDSIAPGLEDELYEYDVDGAKKILEGLGFTMGSDGYYERDGQQLAFEITIPQAFTEQVAAAQIIQSNLKEAGFKVDVNGVAVEAINGITSKGEFQATIGYPIATQLLAVNLYDSWMNPAYSLPIGEAIPTYQNIQRTEDPEIAQYFADYFAATSDDQRTAAVTGLQEQFIEETPWVVLSYYQAYAGWSEKKATGWPQEKDPYWGAFVNPVVALELQPK